MNISRRSFVLGGAATLAAAGIAPSLTGCAQASKSGLDYSKFETKGVKELNCGLNEVCTSKEATRLYNIQNRNGAELCVTNFGARIVSLLVPGKDGQLRDVVLGFDNLLDYANFNENPKNYHGAVVGRYANRIKDGKWSYNGKSYQFTQNENGNTLHGGKFGFHVHTFDVFDYDPSRSISLILQSDSEDEGFPGRSTLEVTYTLNENNTLGICYSMKNTMPCPINVSNHTYWCLSGDPSHPITEDNLTIYSKATTPVDSELIPTGEIRATQTGGVFDFFGAKGEGKLVGKDVNAADEQLKFGKGYDHNFVLMSKAEAKAAGVEEDPVFEITDDGSDQLQDQARLAAKVYCPDSGISMTITTTEPGLQFFDCHDMNGSTVGKKNKAFEKYAAFVLEPQHFPDSPNHPNFPNTILGPLEVYRSKSEYKFSVE